MQSKVFYGKEYGKAQAPQYQMTSPSTTLSSFPKCLPAPFQPRHLIWGFPWQQASCAGL